MLLIYYIFTFFDLQSSSFTEIIVSGASHDESGTYIVPGICKKAFL